ncbi:hypothetical protein VNO78_18041 [Psophocarpus tetragonolobus]|uniref:Translocator protein homolog n=1 Tax=Psophocarpus tetragonolobus TaxID=3891 RepID=A0AAN9SHR5_PSOTE
MATSVLKHRVTPISQQDDKREKRRVMAKRGLRSLGVAVSFPLSLTLLSASVGSLCGSDTHDVSKRPFWFPPWWALHLTCPASSFFMALASWMVWADGGFHTNPIALLLYFTHLLLLLLWDPLVFAAGATRLGLIVSVALFLTQFACLRAFRPLNPIASYFINPSLALLAFLSLLNLKLLFL